MMVAYWYGIKPGGVPALKITKADLTADQIIALPTTSYEAFLFDSEQAKLGYVYDIVQKTFGQFTWTPVKSSNPEYQFQALATEWVQARLAKGGNFGNNIQETHWVNIAAAFPQLPFTPIVEVRQQAFGARLKGPWSTYISLGSGGAGSFAEIGEIRGNVGFDGGTTGSFNYIGNDGFGYIQQAETYTFGLGDNSTSNFPQRCIISAWELPGKNQPLPSYAAAPVAGHLALRLSPTMVRLAYSGHQVTESVPHIFSEARIPAKVLAAGEVTIAAGSSATVSTRLPTTPATYVDYHARKSTEAMFHPPLLPGSARSDSIDIQFEILSAGVTIYNLSTYTMVVRYLVLADDDSAQSSGGSLWQRRANDGVSDYWQLKVPGSSDAAPKLNDIIVDTRLAYLPLVADGYLSAATDFVQADYQWLGEAMRTINFVNNGFRPFVKYATVFSDHYAIPRNRLFKEYFTSTSWGNRCAGDSVNCIVGDTSLTFYMATGNPTDMRLNSSGLTVTHGQKPIGIRWYLFAIPTSL